MKALIGSGVALITPFNEDNTIDFDALGNLIENQIAGEIDYIVALGTTGETATLNKKEKKEIFQFIADKVGGRIPLVAGIGGNNTQEIIDDLKSSDLSGYIAILSVSPYYNRSTQEGIFQHYKALSEASPLPIMLYKVPGRTGSNIEAQTTIRLANACNNIIGIKEASGNFHQYTVIMRDKPTDFLLISGDDGLYLPMASIGASGVISVLANALPAEVSRLTRLCLENNYKDAAKLHAKLSRITDLCFVEGNPAGVKSMLHHLEFCKSVVRLPLSEVSETTSNRIMEELNSL